MSIKVSIIVPVYNVEKYIEKCIKSILNQSINEIQIILIDDGSTDNSSKILTHFSKIDNRILHITKKNEGPGVARNLGVNLAVGEYLYFLDSDDWIEDRMLEYLCKEASEYDSDIVVSGYLVENSQGLVNKFVAPTQYGSVIPREQYVDLFLDLPPFIWHRLFKKSLIIDNSIEFEDESMAEDIMFNLKSFIYANVISINNGSFIHHIERQDSLTSAYKVNIIEVFEKLIKYYTDLFNKLPKNEKKCQDFMNKLKFRSIKEPILNIYCYNSILNRSERRSFIQKFLLNNELNKKKLFSLKPETVFEKIILIMCKIKINSLSADFIFNILFKMGQKSK